MMIDRKIERRGFIGGVLGSVAGLLGRWPKDRATASVIDLDPAPLKPWRWPDVVVARRHFARTPASTMHANWMPVGSSPISSCAGYPEFAAPKSAEIDPFATFSVSTSEVDS